MRELILYTTVSLDGYLAPIYGGFDMLTTISNPEREDYGKNVFCDSIDTVIMGGNTYYELSCIDVEMPFKNKEIYVISQKSMELHKEVRFLKKNAINEIKKLKDLGNSYTAILEQLKGDPRMKRFDTNIDLSKWMSKMKKFIE